MMSNLIDSLKRKTTLRSELKEASAADIERIIGHLNDLLAEREEEEALKAAEFEAKREAIEKIKAAMAEAGLDVEDLGGLELPSVKTKSKAKAAPKYAITVDGQRYEWTGRGRTPVIFAEYMNAKGIDKSQLPSA